jgi:hypothetical protein
MRIDPFLIEQLPRTNPRRLLFSVWRHAMDRYARLFFDDFALPMESRRWWGASGGLGGRAGAAGAGGGLIGGLRAPNGIGGVVEIGAWRGVTTRYLAEAAGRSGRRRRPLGAKGDRNYEAFLRRTADLPKVVLSARIPARRL